MLWVAGCNVARMVDVPKVEDVPKLKLSRRASSAPKQRDKTPPPPITPRNKKASRSLFRELEHTVLTMKHSRKRCVEMQCIVMGTSRELILAVESAEKTLSDNSRMVAGTKDTQAHRACECAMELQDALHDCPMTQSIRLSLKARAPA